MDPSPPSWPQRFLRATPPMPDWLWAGWLMLMAVLVGGVIGRFWCLSTQLPEGSRPSVQHQLDALDTRLKALESR